MLFLPSLTSHLRCSFSPRCFKLKVQKGKRSSNRAGEQIAAAAGNTHVFVSPSICCFKLKCSNPFKNLPAEMSEEEMLQAKAFASLSPAMS